MYFYPLPIMASPIPQTIPLPKINGTFVQAYMTGSHINTFIFEDSEGFLYSIIFREVNEMLGEVVFYKRLDELNEFLKGEHDIFTDINHIYIRSYTDNAIYQFYLNKNAIHFQKKLPIRGCRLQKANYYQKYIVDLIVSFVKCPSSESIQAFAIDPKKPFQQALLTKIPSFPEVNETLYLNTLKGDGAVNQEFYCSFYLNLTSRDAPTLDLSCFCVRNHLSIIVELESKEQREEVFSPNFKELSETTVTLFGEENQLNFSVNFISEIYMNIIKLSPFSNQNVWKERFENTESPNKMLLKLNYFSFVKSHVLETIGSCQKNGKSSSSNQSFIPVECS